MKSYGFGIKNISFKFKKDDPLFFENLSIVFEPGKLHFLQGGNGVGKSTFFRVLHGDIFPTEYISGEYHLNNNIYYAINNAVAYEYKVHVKHVVQDVQKMLVEQMTVAQNIAFTHLKRYPSLNLFSIDTIDDFFLKEAGIFLDQPVQMLSGGQKQLLAIIMSSHNAANVLLLDEPTAALDDANALLVMEVIQKMAIKRNLVVVIICHDASISSSYCSGMTITIKKQQNTCTRVISIE